MQSNKELGSLRELLYLKKLTLLTLLVLIRTTEGLKAVIDSAA
jgi:hypothetical protein